MEHIYICTRNIHFLILLHMHIVRYKFKHTCAIAWTTQKHSLKRAQSSTVCTYEYEKNCFQITNVVFQNLRGKAGRPLSFGKLIKLHMECFLYSLPVIQETRRLADACLPSTIPVAIEPARFFLFWPDAAKLTLHSVRS